MSAFGCFQPPLPCLGIILLNALTGGVHHACRGLGWNVASFGRSERGLERFGWAARQIAFAEKSDCFGHRGIAADFIGLLIPGFLVGDPAKPLLPSTVGRFAFGTARITAKIAVADRRQDV